MSNDNMHKNKQDLIDFMATQADISKNTAETALNSLLDMVTKTLADGGEVAIVNFGSFKTAKRAARTGRNPRTGVEMKIPAAVIAKFKAGKKLKDAVDNSAQK